MDYRQYWNQIFKQNDELNSLISSYWHDYSNLGTWQFWLVVSFMVSPLILLYFTVDRKRIFEIFFFGYTVHILWSYVDIAMGRYGYLVHHYFLTPILPYAINVTASVFPVGFLLLYQYCTNRNKNFYWYVVLLSAVFAFGFATIGVYLGFIEMRKGLTQSHLFLLHIVIPYSAYWLTKLILKLRNTNDSRNREFNLNPFKEKAR